MTALKPRTARVVIYQGDDLARLSELDGAVTRAEEAVKRAERNKSSVRLIHTDDPVTLAHEALEAARAERDEFATEAEPRGVAVVMHAQGRRKWRELMREHGPRDDRDEDKMLGVNMDTLPDALLPISICRDASCPTCSEPDAARTTIEGSTGDFLDSLSDYDYYDRLFLQAFALNRGSAPADPTLRLGSVPSQTSDAISS